MTGNPEATYSHCPLVRTGKAPGEIIPYGMGQLIIRHLRTAEAYKDDPAGFEEGMAKKFSFEERTAIAGVYAELRKHGYYPHKVTDQGTIRFMVPMVDHPAYSVEPEEEDNPQRTREDMAGKRFALIQGMLAKRIPNDDAFQYQRMDSETLRRMPVDFE